MPREDGFARRLLTSVDATGYGRRTDRGQARLQKEMLEVLGDAATRAGLNRPAWNRQVAGDGELAVLPADEPEPRVVDDFVRHLAAALRRHNGDAPDDRRLRLRLAIHHGTAVPGAESYDGGGVVEVSRLCDSVPLRAALAASGADLAVILSRCVFLEVVQNEHTALEPSDFRKIQVKVKEFEAEAYLLVPGHDVHALDLAEASTPRVPPPRTEALGVQNNFYGGVNASKAVFGVNGHRP